MRDLSVAIIAHRGQVTLQPAERTRHVKCRSVDGVARMGVRELVRSQVALRPPA